MLVKLGSTIHLNLQLEDGATDKFPSAILRDKDGTQISVEELTHTGNGLYQNDDQVMPNTDEVTATYLVYEDSDRTTISPLYGAALDVYTLDRTLSLVEDINNSINALVSGSLPGESLIGLIEENGQELTGLIEDQDEAEIVGTLEDSNEIIGHIFDDMEILLGQIDIDPSDELLGLIEC